MGCDINQELSFIRAGDTRWSSHYKTILRLIDLFPSVIKVLEFVEKEGSNGTNQNQATEVLQRKDQDILVAVSMVKSTKEKLEDFRINGFNPLLKKVYSFCEKHNIQMWDMNEDYVNPRNRRLKTNITNRHHYEFDCFNTVVDMQIQEFGDRFSEVSTQLLENMAALNPYDSFSEFNVSKLLRLSELYPLDFNNVERMDLEGQLEMYYANVSKDNLFSNLNGIADLSREMVKTRKHMSYPLVYHLLKLALVLPFATATVERCFSAMKIVKMDLRNRISDDFLNSCVICVIEKEALFNVTNEDVMIRF